MRLKLLLFLGISHLTVWAVDIQALKETFKQTVLLSSICKEAQSCTHSQHKDALLKKINHVRVNNFYWEKVQQKLSQKISLLKTSQFLTLIDLSRQLMLVIFWDSQKEKFYLIGSDVISSGNMEKEALVLKGEDHYLKTPTGVFKVRSGWRSDGTVLSNKITLPYGQDGRFVYYFGKQKSVRYNTFDKNGSKITDRTKWQLIEDELEFAIHAHKSPLPLGTPISHGCIRMSHELNIFLDNHLVLHKNSFDANQTWSVLYNKEPNYDLNVSFAGEYIIIYDSIEEINQD